MLHLTIHNDSTGSDDIGNYNCNVYINKSLLASFRIENHNRAGGWKKLIKSCSDKISSGDINEFNILRDMLEYIIQQESKNLS